MPSRGLFYAFLATLIASGILALVDLIRQKNPDAAKGIEMLAPASGWIGLGLLVSIIVTLIEVLRYLGPWLKGIPVTTIVLLSALVSGAILGLLQITGLLKQFGVMDDAKAAELDKKLLPIKVPVGIVAVLSGIYLFLFSIIQ
ncbi:MAG TPA: hypothetical protein PK297_02665 [Spirochaetota bacterium]|nr:hypothetical protein [Spirochaetota bacterium]